MLCCRHVNHFTSIAAMVYTNRHHGCDRPPAIITKVLVLSVLTKQILSMVDAVKCPICLYMLHQPIELPCHANVCSSCLKEWILGFVSLYDSSAPAAIQSPVFSPPSSYSLPQRNRYPETGCNGAPSLSIMTDFHVNFTETFSDGIRVFMNGNRRTLPHGTASSTIIDAMVT